MSTTPKTADVKAGKKEWFYSEPVKDHFFNPRNILRTQAEIDSYKPDGTGIAGSPVCGDVMKMMIKVDRKNDRITDCKWQTFGCASAIASTSVLSEMLTENNGMPVEQALKLKPSDIIARLSGLPNRKIHCSLFGEKALRAALEDYFRKSGQEHRIQSGNARIVDKTLGITEKEIRQAMLEGAKTLEEVQKKTKAGTTDKTCIQEILRLIELYSKKHRMG